MVKRKNRLPRNRQALVDFLNFDFSVYRRMSKETVPSMPLRQFLDRYGLDSAAGYETARQIQEEMREALFTDAPYGLGLVEQANRYPTKTFLAWSEGNKRIRIATSDPENPREDFYGVLISAVNDDTLLSLQESCKNCQRYYWRKSDFCSLECGREFNDKDAKNRMRRYRLNLKKRRQKHGNR
jgi:hypothetical protein